MCGVPQGSTGATRVRPCIRTACGAPQPTTELLHQPGPAVARLPAILMDASPGTRASTRATQLAGVIPFTSCSSCVCEIEYNVQINVVTHKRHELVNDDIDRVGPTLILELISPHHVHASTTLLCVPRKETYVKLAPHVADTPRATGGIGRTALQRTRTQARATVWIRRARRPRTRAGLVVALVSRFERILVEQAIKAHLRDTSGNCGAEDTRVDEASRALWRADGAQRQQAAVTRVRSYADLELVGATPRSRRRPCADSYCWVCAFAAFQMIRMFRRDRPPAACTRGAVAPGLGTVGLPAVLLRVTQCAVAPTARKIAAPCRWWGSSRSQQQLLLLRHRQQQHQVVQEGNCCSVLHHVHGSRLLDLPERCFLHLGRTASWGRYGAPQRQQQAGRPGGRPRARRRRVVLDASCFQCSVFAYRRSLATVLDLDLQL